MAAATQKEEMPFTDLTDEARHAAHREAYRLEEQQLVRYLEGMVGRPLIAGIADANNVSRWSCGRPRPDRAVWERLRNAATLQLALATIVRSPTSAAQWFTGANPSLRDKSPADELRDGHYTAVFAAVRDIAER